MGSPAVVAEMARTQGHAAAVLDTATTTASRASRQLAGSAWAGPAADTWAASTAPPLHALAVAAAAEQLCAAVLRTWSEVLSCAQATWRQAETLADADVADQRRLAVEQAAQPFSLLAPTPLFGAPPLVGSPSLLGAPPLFGAPPAPCPPPASLRPEPSWPPPLLLGDAGTDPRTGVPAPAPRRPHAEPAYQAGARAVRSASDGESLLVEALIGVAEALEAGRRDLDAATRQPNWAQRNLGALGNVATGFAEAASTTGDQISGLLSGDVDTYRQIAEGVPQALSHPVEAAKATIGWDQLSAGHYAEWAGGLGFTVAAAVLTDGAAGALKSLRSVQALSRLGERIPRLPAPLTALTHTLGEKADTGSSWRHRMAASRNSGPSLPPRQRTGTDIFGDPLPNTGLAVPEHFLPIGALPPSARSHILAGNRRGGGHRSGADKPGKSEFPPSWTDDDIITVVTDIARNPPVGQWRYDLWGNLVLWDLRRDVHLEVVLKLDGQVITAYPVSGPGVRFNSSNKPAEQ